ncbi:MAG TPA: hypothetical protein VGQ06_08395 [Gemmatimonadales bacterium]|jgi:hypothetical protein|nr:hypothetical protein [Gemmatimonadales bacterium]
MYVRRAVVPLALVVLAAGCSDAVGPHSSAVQQPTGQPHFLTWAGGVRPTFTAVGAAGEGGGDGNVAFNISAAGILGLDVYQASFWAVRGEQRSVQINYVGAAADADRPFLRLSNVDPVFVPGVGDLALGDSVLISVTIDPIMIRVSLEPTGLLFMGSTQLDLSYSGAGGDLNGDGVVDATDAAIESQLLGIWYLDDLTWTKTATAPSLETRSFSTELLRFSDYAVSW